jgi:hypothetical protein
MLQPFVRRVPENFAKMTKAILPVLLLLFLLPMRLAGQRAAAPDPLVGCYELVIGKWIPQDHPDAESPVWPPARFRLQAEHSPGSTERGHASVLPLLDGDAGFAFWERVGPDSVQVAWSTGFWGTVLRMHVDGDTLRGTVSSWTDVLYVNADGSPLPAVHAEAVAHRRHCPDRP